MLDPTPPTPPIAPPTVPGPIRSPALLPATKTAIWAFVTGLLSLMIPPVGLISIVLGIVALRQLARGKAKRRGLGLAWTAIGCGAFGAFIVGAIYAVTAWTMVSAISQVQSVGQTMKFQVIHAEAVAHARAHGGYPAHIAAINADPNSSRVVHVFVTGGFDAPAPGEVMVGGYDLANWDASPTSKTALLAAIEGLDTSVPSYAFGDFWFVRLPRPTNEADLVFAWSFDPVDDTLIFITDDGIARRAVAEEWEDYWAADRDARARLGLGPFEPPAGSGPAPADDP